MLCANSMVKYLLYVVNCACAVLAGTPPPHFCALLNRRNQVRTNLKSDTTNSNQLASADTDLQHRVLQTFLDFTASICCKKFLLGKCSWIILLISEQKDKSQTKPPSAYWRHRWYGWDWWYHQHRWYPLWYQPEEGKQVWRFLWWSCPRCLSSGYGYSHEHGASEHVKNRCLERVSESKKYFYLNSVQFNSYDI